MQLYSLDRGSTWWSSTKEADLVSNVHFCNVQKETMGWTTSCISKVFKSDDAPLSLSMSILVTLRQAKIRRFLGSFCLKMGSQRMHGASYWRKLLQPSHTWDKCSDSFKAHITRQRTSTMMLWLKLGTRQFFGLAASAFTVLCLRSGSQFAGKPRAFLAGAEAQHPATLCCRSLRGNTARKAALQHFFGGN